MNAPAISTRGLGKIYGQGEQAFMALRDVDLDIRAGEFVMLAGPSGSGKTTLLSILGCVLTASQGEVSIFGERVSGTPEHQLPRLRIQYMGFVFQGHNLLASLSAEENVALVLQMRGFDVKASLAEARVLLERVGLSHRRNAKPRDLSGGERQRVAICRALAGRPPLVLADEPTASLDAEHGLRVTELLKELSIEHGHTVLVVTHDNRIFHLADRILHIEDGRLLEE